MSCRQHPIKNRNNIRPGGCSLGETREQRNDVISVKGLVHDSHFYVNAGPEVKSRGVSARTQQTEAPPVTYRETAF